MTNLNRSEKFRGLKIYTSKGRVYVYHRASHSRIHSLLGTPEFFAELKAINDNYETSRRTVMRSPDDQK
jgi:hypothetical protein